MDIVPHDDHVARLLTQLRDGTGVPWWPLDRYGLTIEVRDQVLGGATARFDRLQRRVQVQPDVSLRVLAHELGHAYEAALAPHVGDVDRWRREVHIALHGGDPDADRHYVDRAADVPHEDPPVDTPHGWTTMRNPHRQRTSEAFAWWWARRVADVGPARGYGHHRWDDLHVLDPLTFDLVPEEPPMDYPDVPDDHPHRAGIAWATAEGLVTGRPDGTFGPDEPVTRGQLATILHRQTG